VVVIVSGELSWALVIFWWRASPTCSTVIARLGHQQTTLGAMLDPLADKILLMSSYVALTWTSGLRVRIPVWLTVITLSRDAIILFTAAVITLTSLPPAKIVTSVAPVGTSGASESMKLPSVKWPY
jgi:cardiolipin synthase